MRLVLSFLVALVLVGGGTLALTPYDIPMWPAVLMAVLVSQLFQRTPSLRPHALPLSLGYAGLFMAGWIKSFPDAQVSVRLAWVEPAAVGLSLACGFFGLVSLVAQPARRSTMATIAFSVCLASLVAMFSGGAGGPDPMREWFVGLGWSATRAEVAVVTIRKSIHFTFYALLAASAYRGALPSGMKSAAWFAFLFAVSHAVFDETRQRFSMVRMGTPIDVILDTSGILAALALHGVFRANRKSEDSVRP